MVCVGKESWPELLGAEGSAAAAIIEKENPHVDAIVLHKDAITTMEYRCDRVRVRVDDYGIVAKTPRIG
ncbi:unnamed protein product [Spirodela intermedia]|uniref:Uncharacterized protein n=2 Tax=Spirodela intermedia TaxID=51605 RepID=A0A7I8KCN2_SPIIN|nr:unnamed protein product [Spirodela intermedia]CAA6658956.1 unnamed protein product [Spirodela intermedia]CAA6675074.1 unnamed protein product [Spirodela intermedia]CAA7395242.1 unnamed protein product [Spirodela intermedia]